MTVWNLHILDARLALTSVRLALRATVRTAVELAAADAELPDFDIVVRAEAGGGITEWGVAGQAPAPGVIELVLDPARFDRGRLTRTLVHELHHLMRWDGPGYGRSLGEALVSEGLAGHFVTEVIGGIADPWDTVTPAAGLMRRALNEWGRRDYDHGEWFFGKAGLRRWTGYGIGHRIVAEHLSRLPDASAASLAATPAEVFRDALRRLASAEAVPEPAPSGAASAGSS